MHGLPVRVRVARLIVAVAAALGMACAFFAAGSAGAQSSSWSSIDVTFSGSGEGQMVAAANDQHWTKKLTWTLRWTIRASNLSLFSSREKVEGTSVYSGHNIVGACAGSVRPSGAHAILGTFIVPRGGVPIPTGIKGLFAKGIPALGPKHAGQSFGEVQVPIFGPVAQACFGPATMAVAGGSPSQEDVGIIYALFPFSLTHPQPGRYVLPFHKWSYSQPNGNSYDAVWSGTIVVAVST